MGAKTFVILLCALHTFQTKAVTVEEANRRIKECCRKNGVDKDCIDLCTYSPKERDAITNALTCPDKIRVWHYCSGEGNDHTTACRVGGVPNKCLDFCKGDPPICFDIDSMTKFQDCGSQENLDKIQTVRRNQLGAQATWQANHKFQAQNCPDS